jgi:hypothetical protein
VATQSPGSFAFFSTFGTPPRSCRLGRLSTAALYFSIWSCGTPASARRLAVNRDLGKMWSSWNSLVKPKPGYSSDSTENVRGPP